MKALLFVLLIVAGVYFAPTLLAGAFGILMSVAVLLVVAGAAYVITFLIVGSVFTAAMVAALILAVATIGSWLPILLISIFILWLIKRTNTA